MPLHTNVKLAGVSGQSDQIFKEENVAQFREKLPNFMQKNSLISTKNSRTAIKVLCKSVQISGKKS